MNTKQPLFLIKKIKRTPKRIAWSREQDNTLISLVNKQVRRSWKSIAKVLGKTSYQCLLRYRSINPNLRKGAWDFDEDTKVLGCMKVHGRKWNEIAKYFTNRSAKQIRDRYTNYLDPRISKAKFTVEEDLLILELHGRFGNRWTHIKSFLPHRSSDMIKNRYKSSISRNKELYTTLKLSKVSPTG
jgi:hypothetical protein